MQTIKYWQFLLLVVFFVLLGNVFSMEDDDQLMGWNKAHGLWGKRSIPTDIFNKQEKRPENWSKLNTLWGKRSSIPYHKSYSDNNLKRYPPGES
ncbi:unnamed protein product [Auanema sp. JU1783]|nr:unnamed protein product [Auanema sp. JU1783]